MKFVVTGELGRLARWLRILGFDTILFDARSKRELVLCSLREDRVVITRDSGMSRFTGVRMLRIESDHLEEQLAQVIRTLDIHPREEEMFSICVICNKPLAYIAKSAVKENVPPHVFQTNEVFKVCGACKRIYWKGTHWRLAKAFLKDKGCG